MLLLLLLLGLLLGSGSPVAVGHVRGGEGLLGRGRKQPTLLLHGHVDGRLLVLPRRIGGQLLLLLLLKLGWVHDR